MRAGPIDLTIPNVCTGAYSTWRESLLLHVGYAGRAVEGTQKKPTGLRTGAPIAREGVSGAVINCACTSVTYLTSRRSCRNYHNRPMDYADATLVHLAQRESPSTVFTIDHDDFDTYRVGGRKLLRILPPK